jgi:hypothetical protein
MTLHFALSQTIIEKLAFTHQHLIAGSVGTVAGASNMARQLHQFRQQ